MLLRKKLVAFGWMIFIGKFATAQELAGELGKKESAPVNMAAIVMIALAVLLAFVIYILGQVLITLSRQLLENQKRLSDSSRILLVVGFTLLSSVLNAQDLTTESLAKIPPNYGGLSGTAFWTLVTVLITELIVILFIVSYINRIKAELMPEKIKSKKPFLIMEWWKRMDKKIFTAAIPIEKEKDIQLDHDYDGIRELDNSLPPWWKWGFVVTIIAGAFYLMNFHVLGSGQNPTEEYESELEFARIKMEAYAAKNKDKIDENNVPMADAGGIAAGRKIFEQACWACHGKLGEGGAGPNLTDDYWIHKGSLSDIYQSIKIGYPEKGMQAWQKQYTPKVISEIASYIKSIHGTNPPNGKAPQGEVFAELTLADSASIASEQQATSKK
jgi:cytochrome c oxidase cbb3-type subunit 3